MEATADDFKQALGDKTAAGVIFIGHASGSWSETSAGNTFSSNGLLIGGLEDDTVGLYNTKTDANASLVAAFGCDTEKLGSLFGGAGSYIGVNGGTDGESAAPQIAQAGFAAAAAVIQGKNPDQVVAQANSVFVKYNEEYSVPLGRGKGNVTVEADKKYNGDQVVKVR